MYEVTWQEVGRNDRIVIKRKGFESADKRFKFCLSLEKKDSFVRVLGFRNPVETPLVVFE